MVRSGKTFGQKLLSITYDSKELTKNKLLLQYILTIISKYIKEISLVRLQDFQTFQNSIRSIDWISRVFFILNFFRFLKTGKKPTVTDFVLGLNFVSIAGNRMRNLGYNYMTRELMWTGFIVSL